MYDTFQTWLNEKRDRKRNKRSWTLFKSLLHIWSMNNDTWFTNYSCHLYILILHFHFTDYSNIFLSVYSSYHVFAICKTWLQLSNLLDRWLLNGRTNVSVLDLLNGLDRNRMFDITNVEFMFTRWDSSNPELVDDGQMFADMNTNLQTLVRPSRNMGLMKVHQLFDLRPFSRWWFREYKKGVGAIHGAFVFDVHVEFHLQCIITTGVAHPHCFAWKAWVCQG